MLHGGGLVPGEAGVVAGMGGGHGLDGQHAVPGAHALRGDAGWQAGVSEGLVAGNAGPGGDGPAVELPRDGEGEVPPRHVARELHAVAGERLGLERERGDVRGDCREKSGKTQLSTGGSRTRGRDGPGASAHNKLRRAKKPTTMTADGTDSLRRTM